jgi:hypothetical protein
MPSLANAADSRAESSASMLMTMPVRQAAAIESATVAPLDARAAVLARVRL